MFCFGQSALSPLETSRCLLVLMIKFTNKIIFNTNQITYLLCCCLLFVKSEQQSLTSLVHWIRRSRPQTDLQDIRLFHKTFFLWTRKDTQYTAEFKSVSPTDSPATGTRPPWQTGVFSDRQTAVLSDRQVSSSVLGCSVTLLWRFLSWLRPRVKIHLCPFLDLGEDNWQWLLLLSFQHSTKEGNTLFPQWTSFCFSFTPL